MIVTYIFAPVIVLSDRRVSRLQKQKALCFKTYMPVELPTSKASVLCPSAVPAELSMVRPLTVKSEAELMLMS